MDHGAAVGASLEGGVSETTALLAATHRTALPTAAALPFSIGKDDPSRLTPRGLVFLRHLNTVFVAHAELKPLSCNRVKVRRLQAVCSGSDAVFFRRFNDYMRVRSCWVVLEVLHCDVQFFFPEQR